MPLTNKGSEIMGNMKEEYGAKEGEKVFYASKNAGTISGVDALLPAPASPLENLPMTISAAKTFEHARHHWDMWENPHPTELP